MTGREPFHDFTQNPAASKGGGTTCKEGTQRRSSPLPVHSPEYGMVVLLHIIVVVEYGKVYSMVWYGTTIPPFGGAQVSFSAKRGSL
jgi:hypothetical protein